MIFHCTSRIQNLFEKWIELNFFNQNVGDQVNLQHALEAVPVSLCELPPEYTFIFDITRREFPGLEPVIEHFQASRSSRQRSSVPTAGRPSRAWALLGHFRPYNRCVN